MSLTLEPMSQGSFRNYLNHAIKNYALEKEKIGTWTSDTAVDRAYESYERLLPKGLATPNNYLFSIMFNSVTVGYIWIAKDVENETAAFIFDFEIYSDYRNQGFGTEAIALIGQKAQKLGFSALGLHVFGNNSAAIHVYDKAGFFPTDIRMKKML
ncbi:GNAT family N-acetyltransferase [Leuconostoc citreum]